MSITWDDVRDKLAIIAEEQCEWAGLPLPVHGIPLVIEKRHPYANLNGFCFDDGEPPFKPDTGPVPRVINSWYSTSHTAMVYICDDGEGTKRFSVMLPEWGGKKLSYWLTSIGASQGLDANAEIGAMETLQGLVTPAAFNSYILTGSFLETSSKSRVRYLFRKLRPTVAMSTNGEMRILAVLCMHCIGYYEGTWCGCMVPTDDLISHLLLMRADEHRFWKKCNIHPSWSAQAGI